MTLGEIINSYRTENNLSMGDFAKKCGISKAYVSILERNSHPTTAKTVEPTLKCITQIAYGINKDPLEICKLLISPPKTITFTDLEFTEDELKQITNYANYLKTVRK